MKPRPFKAFATVELELYARDAFTAWKLLRFALDRLGPKRMDVKLCVREK